MSPNGTPLRSTSGAGRLDQFDFFRSLSSSKLACSRCASSSVARNASVAATTWGVASPPSSMDDEVVPPPARRRPPARWSRTTSTARTPPPGGPAGGLLLLGAAAPGQERGRQRGEQGDGEPAAQQLRVSWFHEVLLFQDLMPVPKPGV